MGAFLKLAGKVISQDYIGAAQTVKGLMEGWKFFDETEVVVGIPEETNVSREGGINNASLLYLHEQGVPSHNIPPRPVLGPALAQEEVIEQIETLMHDAAEAALVNGDVDTAKNKFEMAGMLGRDACKGYILEGKVAPNSKKTIQAKKRKNKKKNGYEPLALVDTGSMLDSITYAVRKKK